MDTTLIRPMMVDFLLDIWEEIVCESEVFNGNFYTDSNENLHEGYPY